MPLLDHFHPPLSLRRHWHSFHNAWATYLASAFNHQLPEGYFAEGNVQFGIEIDVGSFQETASGSTSEPWSENGVNSAAVSVLGWTPPAPLLTVPFALIGDIVEVQIFGNEGGLTLVGALELVSPANKDREATREAFVSKCATYLQQGIGLVVVDVVTSRSANLHEALMQRLGIPGPETVQADLYAASYRPVLLSEQPQLAMWQEALSIGRTLPTLPLWLHGGIPLQVDLETTYEHTCQEYRVRSKGA